MKTVPEDSPSQLWLGATAAFLGAAAANAEPPQTPIDTVMVYAQKRAAPLTEVPMAVTTLSEGQLADAGVSDMADLAGHVPVLDLQRSVGAATTTLRIRRIGSLGNVPTLEPAVGVFVDGAYRQRPFLTADLLEIGRVEVLPGPQSTLYGRNVGAGLVALYTREPTQSLTAWAELTGGVIDVAGSPALWDMKAGVGGPLSESLRGSVATAYAQHDHTLFNALPGMPDGNDRARWTTRAQLLWSNDPLQVRLIAGYLAERNDQGESDVYLASGSRSANAAADLVARGLAPGCPDNIPGNRRTCSIATNKLDLEALDLTLIAEARLGDDLTLTSTTAWERYDARRTEDDAVQLFTPILYFHDLQAGDALQEELRLLSTQHERVSWMAGVFYYRNDFERGERGAEPTFGVNGPAAYDASWPLPFGWPDQHGFHDSRTRTDYGSVFAEATWKLSARLQLVTGLRWHEEDKEASIANSVTRPEASVISSVLTPAASPSGAPVNGRISRSSDALTWSVTPQYRFSDEAMAWLTAARGAKSGGFNNGTGNAPLAAREFGDETIHHYEIGARAAPARSDRAFSAAVFHTQYHDYQDAVFALGQFSVGSVERMDLTGVELAAQSALGERTRLDAAVSYVDLEYVRHTAGMCFPGRAPDGSAPQSCDLSGERPLNAPPWEARLGLEHSAPRPWGEFFGRIDWVWTDRYDTTFSLDPRLVQDAWHDVGLRVGARIGANSEVVLWGRNLLDENVAQISSTLNFFNDPSWQYFFGEPRSFGLTLRMRL